MRFVLYCPSISISDNDISEKERNIHDCINFMSILLVGENSCIVNLYSTRQGYFINHNGFNVSMFSTNSDKYNKRGITRYTFDDAFSYLNENSYSHKDKNGNYKVCVKTSSGESVFHVNHETGKILSKNQLNKKERFTSHFILNKVFSQYDFIYNKIVLDGIRFFSIDENSLKIHDSITEKFHHSGIDSNG